MNRSFRVLSKTTHVHHEFPYDMFAAKLAKSGFVLSCFVLFFSNKQVNNKD